MLGKPQDQVNLVICHLGAGSSMAAVQVRCRCRRSRRVSVGWLASDLGLHLHQPTTASLHVSA